MKNYSNHSYTVAFIAFLGIAFAGVSFSVAQSEEKKPSKKTRSLRSRTKEDSSLISVFKPLAISASESTVKVLSGRRQIAVGTVVGREGLVLTKASEMRGDLKCRLPNGDVKDAMVFGIDQENDLALLKIDADGLAEAPMTPVDPPTQGMWLVSPTDQNGTLTVGVVGVDERKIPPSRAFIGIQMLDAKDGGVLITAVVDGSPASKAKLRPDDVLIKFDTVDISNRRDLTDAIGLYNPESTVEVTVKRKDTKMVVSVTLADITKTSEMYSRSRLQNNMGSRVSRRGKDFPRAFQHDMALQANQIGGPVVDLDGQIVGVNIAREGRVSSLAIPVDAVLDVIGKLKTGEFSPVKVYADRIKSSETELESIRDNLEQNLKSVEEAELGFKAQTAKIEELERMKRELAERIKEVYEERENLSKKKGVLKSKNSEAEKAIRKLERQLDAIKAGKKY